MESKEDIIEVRKRKAQVYKIVKKFFKEVVENDNMDLELITSVDVKETQRDGFMEKEPGENRYITISVKPRVFREA